MTTTEKLKAYWYFLPLIALIIVTIVLANNKYCNQHAANYTIEKRQLDSTRILLDQERYLFDLSNKQLDKLQAFTKKYQKDTATHKAVKDLLNTQGLRMKEKLGEKNKQLIGKNGEIYSLGDQTGSPINVWLLLTIVLVCGTIGGVARTYYPLLVELKPVVQQRDAAEAKMQVAKESNSLEIMAETNAELSVLNRAVQQIELKNTPGRVMFTNLMFGLIASLLAFVAMEAFKSKVLDFINVLDYFILAGWCVLGAVFAKKWLFAIHAKITG